MTRAEQEAVVRFHKEFEKAADNLQVSNPLTHALYKTWRYYDAKEKRSRKNGNIRDNRKGEQHDQNN